jgi:hypothetical protein
VREAENIGEGPDGDGCTGNEILFRDDIQTENFHRFPGATAQIMRKLPIIEKATA